MTVQELIDLLKKQDPTDVVTVETIDGNVLLENDWARCHGYIDGELYNGFCLIAHGDTEFDHPHPDDCPVCQFALRTLAQ